MRLHKWIKFAAIVVLTFILGNNPVLGGSSVFEVAYSKWITGKTITSLSNDEGLQTILPYNELILTQPDSNTYLLHKSASGVVFAVEKIVGMNGNPSTRNRHNQLAGMMLWCLENGLNDMFWSYATSGSVEVKTNFLSFSKSKNDSLCQAVVQKKSTVELTATTDEAVVIELKSAQLEFAATFLIKARLLDLIGNDPNQLSEFLFNQHKMELSFQEAGFFERSTSNLPFRGGLKWAKLVSDTNWTVNGTFTESVENEFKEAVTFSDVWLTQSKTKLPFLEKAKMEVFFVGRDTLKAESIYPAEKVLFWLKNSLMNYGEIPAIGLLSVKERESNKKSVRYLLVFRNEVSAHEHVVRADVEFEQKNEFWKIGNAHLLVMLATPLGNATN